MSMWDKLGAVYYCPNPKCKASIRVSIKDLRAGNVIPHVCYFEREHDDVAPSNRPELNYRADFRTRNHSGECSCKGRNENCIWCNGTGWRS